MDLPTPTARYLSGNDRDVLTSFECSRGTWYENDVQRFINERIVDHHEWRRVHTDHTLIGLELPRHGLVAVGSHEEDLTHDGDARLTSTYLEVGAVALPLQGAILPEVEPLDPDGKSVSLGRWLAEVLLSDIARLDRDPVIRSIVARENERSLALCDRIGLVRERNYADDRFVQRWGVLQR